jgi:hypothetical protein
VLAWLLGERDGQAARAALDEADLVTASDLTVLECERSLLRGVTQAAIPERRAAHLRGVLMRATAHWRLMPISSDIVDRARQPFPAEPIRSLDAIHLSSALLASTVLPGVRLLSLDRRMRTAAAGLGLPVEPGRPSLR